MSDDTGKALVACPTYAGKEYALEEWVRGFNALTYEFKVAYQVDNTRVSQGYYNRLKETGIDVTHLTPWPDWDRTFKKCWELILNRAEDLNCYWVYSVEADNVPAPESLEIMVNLALYGKVHLVTHAYPMHRSAVEASGIPEYSFYYHELGCMLMTRSLLKRALAEFDLHGNVALAIFRTNDKYHGGHIKLTNCFEVKHLDGYYMEFQNLVQTTVPGVFCPTPKVPDDYGSELPPSLR